MIRSGELSYFLDSILNTLAQELRPELKSSHAQKSADQLIEVLTRLAAQVRDGDRLAAAQLEHWRQLSRQLADLGGKADGAPAPRGLAQREQLELELETMQRVLLDDGFVEQFTRALEDPSSAESRWHRDAAAASFELWDSNEDSVHVLSVRMWRPA